VQTHQVRHRLTGYPRNGDATTSLMLLKAP